MKNILTALIAAAVIGTTALPMSSTANAGWGYRGYHGVGYPGFGYRRFGYRGWGYGFVAGAAIGATLAAPYPYYSNGYNPYVGYYPPGGYYHVGYYPPGYPYDNCYCGYAPGCGC
jgi:hypothetical protein